MKALKTIWRGICAFLPHLLLTYGLMLLTFFVINIFNEPMGFLNSHVSRVFEIEYFAAAVLMTAIAIIENRLCVTAFVYLCVACAFILPVFRAVRVDSPLPLDTVYFRVMSLVFSLATIAFAVAQIVLGRADAKKRYEAENAEASEPETAPETSEPETPAPKTETESEPESSEEQPPSIREDESKKAARRR